MRKSLFLFSLLLPSRNADIVIADISNSAEVVTESESISKRGNPKVALESSEKLCVRATSAARVRAVRFRTPDKMLVGEIIRVGDTTDNGAASGVATITACSINVN